MFSESGPVLERNCLGQRCWGWACWAESGQVGLTLKHRSGWRLELLLLQLKVSPFWALRRPEKSESSKNALSGTNSVSSC